MRGGVRKNAGRKPVLIDLVELEKLAALQSTDVEIAKWFRVSPRTIEMRRKQPEFAEAINRGRAMGQISVRRAQMKILESGSAAMGIWLGKQLLGQRDVMPVEISGPNEQPVKFSLEVVDAILAKNRKRKKTL